MAEEKNLNAQAIVEDWLLLAKSDDRGALAALRRGANQATEDRAWPYVARWCGDLCNDRSRNIVLGCAAAFAFHPEHSACGCFGESLRKLALSGDGKPDEALERFAPRLRRLLSIDDAAEIATRIPALARRCGLSGIAVNYQRLLDDLQYWGERAQLRWARDYWSSQKPAEGGQ